MSSEDDAELVGRCLRGETQAFEALVARYQRVLFNVALRMVGDREDARDVAQTTFVKAYEKLGTYDPAYRFFSWLYRIMLNESLNLRERRTTHQPLHADLASGDDPLEAVRLRELSEHLQAGLLELSPEHREVLVMRHFGELSYGEIGELLGIAEKTVKSRLYTARQRLAEILGALLGPRSRAH